jgi:hypothetical protein
VKYLLLIYSNPKVWGHPMFLHQDEELTDDERARRLKQFGELMDEINDTGELITAGGLAAPSTGRFVQLTEEPTDGPFSEAKEQLAGFFLVDCDSIERATELASRFPDARQGGVEVRPIMDEAGMEM